MKKAIAMTALVTIIGLTGMYQASATCGQAGMRGNGNINCPGGRADAIAQMDDATKVKFDAFLKDTQALRKDIAIKRAEKRALMHADNPDAAAVGKLAGELFDLRAAMHAKAEEAGLADIIGKGSGVRDCDGQDYHHGRIGMPKKGHGMMGSQAPAAN